MVTISVATDLDRFAAKLDDMAKRQLRFATARALTATALACRKVVTDAIPEEFDNPTPFTRRAIGTASATKSTLSATVFVKDTQAQYLRVQELGGRQFVHGLALLEPKNIKLNQYGNLPRSKLRALAQQPDIFIGRIKFKNGQSISGVWRRPPAGQRRTGTRGTKGNTQAKVAGQRTGLQLLIRFADGAQVAPRFHFRDQVQRTAAAAFPANLEAALTEALKTAK